jgi:hypothetical protein
MSLEFVERIGGSARPVCSDPWGVGFLDELPQCQTCYAGQTLEGMATMSNIAQNSLAINSRLLWIYDIGLSQCEAPIASEACIE